MRLLELKEPTYDARNSMFLPVCLFGDVHKATARVQESVRWCEVASRRFSIEQCLVQLVRGSMGVRHTAVGVYGDQNVMGDFRDDMGQSGGEHVDGGQHDFKGDQLFSQTLQSGCVVLSTHWQQRTIDRQPELAEGDEYPPHFSQLPEAKFASSRVAIGDLISPLLPSSKVDKGTAPEGEEPSHYCLIEPAQHHEIGPGPDSPVEPVLLPVGSDVPFDNEGNKPETTEPHSDCGGCLPSIIHRAPQ